MRNALAIASALAALMLLALLVASWAAPQALQQQLVKVVMPRSAESGGAIAPAPKEKATSLAATIARKWALERLPKLDQIGRQLLREVRIASGINVVGFAMASLLLLRRRPQPLTLKEPAVVVLTALIVTGLGYLRQDWPITVLRDSYWGWSYLLWCTVIGLLTALVLSAASRVSWAGRPDRKDRSPAVAAIFLVLELVFNFIGAIVSVIVSAIAHLLTG